MEKMPPFYDPTISYEDNYHSGPYGDFADTHGVTIPTVVPTKLFGLPVNTPFGIPSGPLLNSRYVKAAFQYGFDLCVYKTVRTREHKSHPLPNVLAIHPKTKLSNQIDTVLANNNYTDQPLSITNSFGVPSFSPDIWQPDMAAAVKSAGKGQLLIGSFQGTKGTDSIEDDYALAARLVAETGAPVLEANLSCPNEGVHKLLCFDIDKVQHIVTTIKNTVPDRPLVLKLAYFTDTAMLRELLQKVGHIVAGFSTINTLSARPVDANGQPALSADRPEGGVCGDAIRWAGLDMVQRLANLRADMGLSFSIVGVGGVNSPEHYRQYLNVGADAVMSATGSMWNPHLAIDIKKV